MLIAASSCGACSVLTEMFRQSLDEAVSVCAATGAKPARTAVNIVAAIIDFISSIAFPCGKVQPTENVAAVLASAPVDERLGCQRRPLFGLKAGN
jgi:hypothetical protein